MSPFFGQEGGTYTGGGGGGGGGSSVPHYAGGLGLEIDDDGNGNNNDNGGRRYRVLTAGDEDEATLFPLTLQTSSSSSSSSSSGALSSHQGGAGVGDGDGFRSLTSMAYASESGRGSPGSLPSHSPLRLSPDARGQPRSKSFDSSGGTITLLRASPTFRPPKLERRDSLSSTRSSRR